MKRCPFCSEEIQLEALKCKHCGEWLNKKSLSDSILGKTTSFIKNQKDSYLKRRYKHLFIPEKNNPLEVNGILFFPNHLEYQNHHYEYSKIASIKYFASSDRTNGIQTETENKFKIYFDTEQTFPISQRENIKSIDLSRSSFFGLGSGKKTREKMNFIQNYLKKVTFDFRLEKYLTHIQLNKFFYYPNGYKIYVNGDIEYANEICDNIVVAKQEERLDYGNLSFSSSRVHYSNPFELFIWKSKKSKKNLLFSGRTASMMVIYDKDIFDALLIYLLKKGTL